MPKRISLQGKGVDLFFPSAAEDPARARSESSGPADAAPQHAPSATRSIMHARTHPTSADDLLRALSAKQRLASSTFRFQPDELERLDVIVDELSHAHPRRISKNDLVRLGLLWLLADYEADPDQSLVGRLLTRF
ncbi:MAG: hypothetical protein EXR58_07985 [Chloroflexi bacterium]|nr:hypothetical protein [Chloroflexota bacterium]